MVADGDGGTYAMTATPGRLLGCDTALAATDTVTLVVMGAGSTASKRMPYCCAEYLSKNVVARR